MQGIDVRLDCILRRGIELVRWSSSQSPTQDIEKTKKDLAAEGFRGEFVPMVPRSRDQPTSARKAEEKSGEIIFRLTSVLLCHDSVLNGCRETEKVQSLTSYILPTLLNVT